MLIFSNARFISTPGSADTWTPVPPAAWNTGPPDGRGCGSVLGGTYCVRGLLILVRVEERAGRQEVEAQILCC